MLLTLHGVEELGVRLRRLQSIQQKLHGLDLLHGMQELSQYPDLL